MRTSRVVAALSLVVGVALLVVGFFTDRHQTACFAVAAIAFAASVVVMRRSQSLRAGR